MADATLRVNFISDSTINYGGFTLWITADASACSPAGQSFYVSGGQEQDATLDAAGGWAPPAVSNQPLTTRKCVAGSFCGLGETQADSATTGIMLGFAMIAVFIIA